MSFYEFFQAPFSCLSLVVLALYEENISTIVVCQGLMADVYNIG